MTQERWDWPFKTLREMELAKKYFAKRMLESLPPALM
jgi:hypothetical protein